jgi:hypothetical protein
MSGTTGAECYRQLNARNRGPYASPPLSSSQISAMVSDGLVAIYTKASTRSISKKDDTFDMASLARTVPVAHDHTMPHELMNNKNGINADVFHLHHSCRSKMTYKNGRAACWRIFFDLGLVSSLLARCHEVALAMWDARPARSCRHRLFSTRRKCAQLLPSRLSWEAERGL